MDVTKAENLRKRADAGRKAVNTLRPDGVHNIHMTSTNNIHVKHDNHLMEKVLERNNRRSALERVEQNAGAPGIDGMKTQELRSYLTNNWKRIKDELLDGTYKPSSVRRVEIPKPDGGVRELGIPTVLDRFIQQAIQQVLTPIFEQTFSDHSYGFRPKRSAQQAVQKAQSYIQTGKRFVVDIDLEKFFDRVNHDILMTKIFEHVKDRRILRIIRKYLKSGVMLNGCHVMTEEGTPQGGPISPLLANIMLNDLDKLLEHRRHSFVRYADDCNIYVASKRAGMRVFQSINNFIEKHLKLKVNFDKSAIDRPWKRKFLGFTFSMSKNTSIRLAPKTLDKFKQRVRELTKGRTSMSMEWRIKKLNEYLVGWSGYFWIAQTKTVFVELDSWIRVRLRMCTLNRWKRGKTKLRKLMALGLRKEWARMIAHSGKGSWRLAHTHQINMVLDFAYWQKQGLRNLVERCHELRVAV